MNIFWAKPITGQCQSKISDPERQIVPRHRCNMLDQILLVPCLCCDPELCCIQADQDQRTAACWTRGAERCGGVVSCCIVASWMGSLWSFGSPFPHPSTFSRHLNDSSMVGRASEWGPWSPIWRFPVLHFKKHGPHCKVQGKIEEVNNWNDSNNVDYLDDWKDIECQNQVRWIKKQLQASRQIDTNHVNGQMNDW